ncbi:gastrula zinc finger protein XlCGF28.1-like [Silurus meridionalis]|nr:gastrula zinc finger protein XlCGF28.1-like [Silurus meridionalis]
MAKSFSTPPHSLKHLLIPHTLRFCWRHSQHFETIRFSCSATARNLGRKSGVSEKYVRVVQDMYEDSGTAVKCAIRPLQTIQNAVARLVFNQPKFSHTTPLLRSLHWLPVAARIRFKTLMLAYKAKNGPAPSYLSDLITSRTAPRCLRSSSTARLVPTSLRMRVSKTKELIVDLSTTQEWSYQPLNINRTPVERVDSFRYLGVHITQDLSWSCHTNTLVKKARQRLYHLRCLMDCKLPSQVLKTFYTCIIESVLTSSITSWFGNSTMQDRQALQRVVCSAEGTIHTELPNLQNIYSMRCQTRARKIVKDLSHPNNGLFSSLRSGKRFRSLKANTERMKRSFFP